MQRNRLYLTLNLLLVIVAALLGVTENYVANQPAHSIVARAHLLPTSPQ